ncbi:MAG: redoxin domain-containing protein [Candidatus Saccharicenans sp.]|nr:redoxin domain-containing protein [Candidatus Saccharicenans sp.]
MKSKLGKVAVVFLLIFLGAMVFIVKNDKLRIKDLFIRNKIPSLFLLNDNVPEIEVINSSGFRETITFTHMGKKALIFILNRSCVPCEKNIAIGERLYDQINAHADVLGIVVGEIYQASALQEALKLRFPLYVPENIQDFLRLFGKSKSSLTILVREDGKIEWIKIGDLNADDYLNLKNLILR